MAKNRLPLLLSLPLFLLSSCGGSESVTIGNMARNRRIAIGSAPFEAPLLYQRGQQWVGPEAELGKQISEKIVEEANKQGNTAEIETLWVGLDYENLIPTLSSKEVDFVLAVFGITEERQEQVEFSNPYYSSELALIINPVQADVRADKLGGVDIGVRASTAVEEFVRRKYPNANLIPFNTLDDGVLALKRGEISAVIDDRYMVAYSLDTMPGVGYLEMTPDKLGTIDCAVAVRKEDRRLLNLINEVVADAKGHYHEWLGDEVVAQVERVGQRYAERMERDRMASQPRRLVIQVSKDANYDFDIYRMANLSFTLTEQETGQSYSSSRIDFKNRVGISSLSLPPGTYRIVLPKMNNWSPGSITVQPSDPDRVTVSIQLLRGGQVRMQRS